MKVNPCKFQGIVFNHNHHIIIHANLEFHLTDGIIIKPNDNLKLLGVKIDDKLNFPAHVKDLITKCAK